MRPAPQHQLTSIRVVPELRAAHLARIAAGVPARVLYLDAKYDLVGTTIPHGPERCSLGRALLRLVTTDADVLELPEPLWIRFWPKSVALAVAFRAGGVLRRRQRRRRICAHAMETNDLARLVGGSRDAPRVVVRAVGLVVGLAMRLLVDRVHFASPRARSVYAGLPFVAGVPHRTTLELPGRGQVAGTGRPGAAVFVGTLEARKGVRELMAAWEQVERTVPDAHLTVIGDGPLRDVVRDWSSRRPASRHVAGAVPHRLVGPAVAGASVLVAPSVPDGRWREQIGLPIKEALSCGVTVVTTAQTGLAGWLVANGHQVVSVDEPDLVGRLAVATERALAEPLDRQDVLATLPLLDGRMVADAWLHAA